MKDKHYNVMDKEDIIKKLQNEAAHFLTESKLMVSGLAILPKEIEVYYYKEGDFEDSSVHRNILQQNNQNHFYIHRWGIKKEDSYKGGNYPGIDFVLSNEKDIYYSYLIRSAVVDNDIHVGPHKVLEAIIDKSGLTTNELESSPIEILPNSISCDVLFSSRINLGKNAQEFSDYKLRAVLCDEWFGRKKYPAKEKMVVDFLTEKVRLQNMTPQQAMEYANKKLGYIPSSIRAL